jgi:hypothetical protein
MATGHLSQVDMGACQLQHIETTLCQESVHTFGIAHLKKGSGKSLPHRAAATVGTGCRHDRLCCVVMLCAVLQLCQIATFHAHGRSQCNSLQALGRARGRRGA